MPPRTEEEIGYGNNGHSKKLELSTTGEENTGYDEVDAQEQALNDDENRPSKNWPEKEGTRFQQIFKSWTYSYMMPLLQKGRHQFKDGSHLTQQDLFAVPQEMVAKKLVEEFRALYTAENGELLHVLWKLAAPTFIPAGFMQLAFVVARVTLPMAMRQLLTALEENPNQSVIRQGLPWAVLIFCAAILAAFAQHRETHLATKSGIVMRAALISIIYEHSLRLSAAGQAGITTGEVTNLVATDTQKLFEVCLEGHLIWSCPLFVLIVAVLLWVVMGPELLVGVVVLIGFVPVVKYIVSRMLMIRKKRATLADERINIITAILQGIRVTKLNHYESKVLERVNAVRDKEIILLRSELFMWGWTMVVAVSSPLVAIAAAFSFYALVNEDNIITPSSAFTVLLLFSILRFPINMGARLVGKLAQALDSAKRISDFLQRETVEAPLLLEGEGANLIEDSALVDVVGATFQTCTQQQAIATSGPQESTRDDETNATNNAFTVSNVSLSVHRGHLCSIVGRVGSGKSVLLQGLLGEMQAADKAKVSMRGSIGYAAQVPFILNTTLRENILFGLPFDQQHYRRVLAACSLEQDMQRFPGGDLCQIGERGVTLSGGQKQRVSLARVLYARPSIALLDDVFSALDAETSKAVFSGLFGAEGALNDQATVLVTHATSFLNRMDQIVVLSEGAPIFSGSFEELQNSKSDEASHALGSYLTRTESSGDLDASSEDNQPGEEPDNEKEQMIMTAEEREFGLSKFSTWLVWFKYAGGWTFFLLQFLFLVMDRSLYVSSEWWIATWTDASDESTEAFGREFPPQTDGRSAQIQYIVVYFIILALSITATTIRSHWGVQGGARCAESLFKIMICSVLGSPVSYFETTPLGRILNRFTYDIEVLDIELSVSMAGLLISCSWFTASIVVMITVLPWIVCVLVPVVGLYFLLQSYHRLTGPDLQRLDAMSRSPLQAQLAEALDGAVTIRAFKQHSFFVDIFHASVNRNSAAMLNFDAAQRWLALRIELLGSIITLSVCTFVVFGNGILMLPAGLVGFLIMWSIVFTTSLGFLLQRFTETEARITAIERVSATSELPQEAAWETDASFKLEPSWPSRGYLQFDNVCLRYREELPLALDSVSFEIPAGSRVGVVGRTGSGKSTLTVALFRLVEIESGYITLDGVDLSKIGLSDVRGRKSGLRIIPQDPVLFAGSLRDCIDPFRTATDEALLDALKAVNHAGWERGLDVLSDCVEEGGANYSVGERQLLCLARAIVEEPRVLVMDEASASLDNESDKRIQKMLRERFAKTTMLTIAHRLDTILDYDSILVLDEGRVAEFGPPPELLSNPDGIFSALVGQSSAGGNQDGN
ncbi:Oligomycin resistance ATP-dependent permease YOR1 [Seminavis robusta]|uniref:Oligomycin resistance ATP-dependent permease YOR1 n=1 Tax=Seminavis robusta TaxID=568900 RepID=A0A9N8DEE3_9STRA|nr:Oligomycin resistance ATP-dependent permease YOR1 [Seminavis robusta]|eukprot:Sro50_g028990.1 Oligomycin resistance ATP-dependent permease YOR1 (1346) ;mRNA; f:43881-48429